MESPIDNLKNPIKTEDKNGKEEKGQ